MHTVEASVVMAVVFLSIAMLISFACSRRSSTADEYKKATVAIDEADTLNENEAEDYMRFTAVAADFVNSIKNSQKNADITDD